MGEAMGKLEDKLKQDITETVCVLKDNDFTAPEISGVIIDKSKDRDIFFNSASELYVSESYIAALVKNPSYEFGRPAARVLQPSMNPHIASLLPSFDPDGKCGSSTIEGTHLSQLRFWSGIHETHCALTLYELAFSTGQANRRAEKVLKNETDDTYYSVGKATGALLFLRRPNVPFSDVIKLDRASELRKLVRPIDASYYLDALRWEAAMETRG